MLLKSFEKVNASPRTQYDVFDKLVGEYVTTITVDRVTRSGFAGLAVLEDEGAKVENVSVNSATGVLRVTVIV